MKFNETKFSGVYLITLNPYLDERGFFARNFCKQEMAKHGLHSDFVQCNISYNRKKGTVRGLHYQIAPHEEVKIVTCIRGCIFDVVVDVRKNSSTYGQWLNVELSAENHHALYIPAGLAHGFQTQTDDAEVFYWMGNYYEPSAARGIRWNDPNLGIAWPESCTLISDKDQSFPEFFS